MVFTANTKNLDPDEIIDSCPYNIPRKGDDGTMAKCDMCHDRVQNGLLPAGVKTCPTGALNFGDRNEMLGLAEKRLAMVKKAYTKAMLLDAEDIRVVYLVAYPPDFYHDNAMASNSASGIPRYLSAG